jgi:predicted nucleic acid-binding protein
MPRPAKSSPLVVATPSTLFKISRCGATPHNLLLARVWELRHNLTAYDAVYVVLTEVFDARLLTRDRRIAAAAAHHATVEFV